MAVSACDRVSVDDLDLAKYNVAVLRVVAARSPENFDATAIAAMTALADTITAIKGESYLDELIDGVRRA